MAEIHVIINRIECIEFTTKLLENIVYIIKTEGTHKYCCCLALNNRPLLPTLLNMKCKHKLGGKQ